MKLVALLLAIALTAGLGYASQAAMAADAGRFVRLTEGLDPAAVWLGGTLPPLVVTGTCETGGTADRATMRRHAATRGAAMLRNAGTLPAIVVTARAPTIRRLATDCGATPSPTHAPVPSTRGRWHVD